MSDRVHMTRTLDASIDDVFDAWVDSQKMSDWHAPKGKTANVTVNGEESYEITFHDPEKHEDQTVRGKYKEFDRPNKLVFTWNWDMPDAHETLVTVNFKNVDGKTEMELIHVGFANAEEAKLHDQGWESVLESLEKYFKE